MEPGVADQIRQRYESLVHQLGDPEVSPLTVARGFGQLGSIYRAYRLLPEAEECFASAVRFDPKNARWHYFLGHVTRSQGRLSESDASFRRTLELRPEDVPTLVWLAENALDQRDLEVAEQHFERAVRLRPQSARAHFGRGRVELERGEVRAALDHLEAALALQPEATPILYTLGLTWSRLGDPDQADSFFARVPDDDRARIPIAFDDPLLREVADLRESAQSFALSAQKAISQRRYDVAVRDLQRAVELAPERSDTRYNLAACLLLLDRRDEAQGHLERLVAIDPHYVQGFLLLGRVYTVSGDLEQAEQVLLRAQELDPGLTAGPLDEVRRLRGR